MVHLAQINVVGLFEHEMANVLLLDEVAIPVLLWRAGCPAEFGFQVSARDPSSNGMRIDPQRLRL